MQKDFIIEPKLDKNAAKSLINLYCKKDENKPKQKSITNDKISTFIEKFQNYFKKTPHESSITYFLPEERLNFERSPSSDDFLRISFLKAPFFAIDSRINSA